MKQSETNLCMNDILGKKLNWEYFLCLWLSMYVIKISVSMIWFKEEKKSPKEKKNG